MAQAPVKKKKNSAEWLTLVQAHGRDRKSMMRQKCAGFSVLKFTGFYHCTDFAVHKTILNHINVLFQVTKQCMPRI